MDVSARRAEKCRLCAVGLVEFKGYTRLEEWIEGSPASVSEDSA